MAGGGDIPQMAMAYQHQSEYTPESFRSPVNAPLRKLTVDLIKTYRKINEVEQSMKLEGISCIMANIVSVVWQHVPTACETLCLTHGRTHGHMARHMDTWLDTWPGTWTHGRTHGWAHGHMAGHVDTWLDTWVGTWTHGRTHGWAHGHMAGHTWPVL